MCVISILPYSRRQLFVADRTHTDRSRTGTQVYFASLRRFFLACLFASNSAHSATSPARDRPCSSASVSMASRSSIGSETPRSTTPAAALSALVRLRGISTHLALSFCPGSSIAPSRVYRVQFRACRRGSKREAFRDLIVLPYSWRTLGGLVDCLRIGERIRRRMSTTLEARTFAQCSPRESCNAVVASHSLAL